MPTLPWLSDTDPLPPTRRAWPPGSDAPGLLAAGGGLSTARLAQAYRHGVFPWFSAGQPVLWWSPDPRMVLPVAEFKLSRSLRRTIARFIADPTCEVRIDSAFEEVIRACAQAPRDRKHGGQGGTWIVEPMIDAYLEWHRAGAVHSVETWIDGALAGGLYGIGIGRMFFGESMFARRSDASKIALAALVCFCRANGIALIDCQQNTAHLASLGAHEVTRAEFERHLERACAAAPPDEWKYHPSLWTHLSTDPRA